MNISELFQLKSAGVLNFSELFQLKKTISANGRASYTKIPNHSRVAEFWLTRSQTAKPYIVQSTAQSPSIRARALFYS